MIQNDPTSSAPLALVIEDEQDLADIFAIALIRAGFHSEIINDGQMALDKLQLVTPAVIVLDLQLPLVSGETILRRVRADERFADTRIIIASANPHRAQRLRLEGDLILEKPISFGQLRDLAARLKPAG